MKYKALSVQCENSTSLETQEKLKATCYSSSVSSRTDPQESFDNDLFYSLSYETL